jgi:hypothetical protein
MTYTISQTNLALKEGIMWKIDITSEKYQIKKSMIEQCQSHLILRQNNANATLYWPKNIPKRTKSPYESKQYI